MTWPKMSAVLTIRSPNQRADVRTDLIHRMCLALGHTHSRCLIKLCYSSFRVVCALLSTVGCFSAPLHLCPLGTLPHPQGDHQKHLQTLSNTPWRHDLPDPTQNHGSKAAAIAHAAGGETEARRGAGKAPTASGPVALRESRTS